MKNILNELKSSEWEDTFIALDKFRSLIIHHNKLLYDENFISEAIRMIAKLADSLRSNISKNALLVINNLFTYLKSNIINNLDIIIPVLMKKASDNNSFLSLEAESALILMCQNCNEHNCIAGLIS